MSDTSLETFLDYISDWSNETEENINELIKEHNLFLSLGDFDPAPAINSEFAMLVGMAKEVRNLTVAADATAMAADTAAVASLWSFGFGAAAFVAAEVTETIEEAVLSKKSHDFSQKLATIDSDIATRISPTVRQYVRTFKANNNLIMSQAPKGLDVQQCRSILFEFMTWVQYLEKELTAGYFKKYAISAAELYNSEDINEVYYALNQLNLSQKSESDVTSTMNVLAGLEPEGLASKVVQCASVTIMVRMKIKAARLRRSAEAAELDSGITDSASLEMIETVGKFASGLVILSSIIDIVLNVYDIVEVVDQCNKMVDQLGIIQARYLSFYDGIKNASERYRTTLKTSPLRKWRGFYVTKVKWWGDSFQLEVNEAGWVTIGKTALETFHFDDKSNTLTIPRQEIQVGDDKKVRAEATVVFSQQDKRLRFSGTIKPRMQDGPISYQGTAQ